MEFGDFANFVAALVFHEKGNIKELLSFYDEKKFSQEVN